MKWVGECDFCFGDIIDRCEPYDLWHIDYESYERWDMVVNKLRMKTGWIHIALYDLEKWTLAGIYIPRC